MRYGVVGRSGEVEHEVAIDLPGLRLPHDMAITEHYSLLMDLPLVADTAAARQGRHKIVFDQTTPARFGVIPRRGRADEIRWFEAEPCYIYHVVNAWIYHVVNAWEQGRTIILDVCQATRPEPIATRPGALAKLLAYLRLDARLHRYVFDLDTGTTTETQLDDANTEFPSIDTRRCGRPSRYDYNIHIADTETVLFDGLLRYDSETGERQDTGLEPAGSAARLPSPRGTAVSSRTTGTSSASSPKSARGGPRCRSSTRRI